LVRFLRFCLGALEDSGSAIRFEVAVASGSHKGCDEPVQPTWFSVDYPRQSAISARLNLFRMGVAPCLKIANMRSSIHYFLLNVYLRHLHSTEFRCLFQFIAKKKEFNENK
jgi:hypothetical protein